MSTMDSSTLKATLSLTGETFADADIAAAITAATYHATGVRVRELPIKIEDLLTSSILT